MTTLILQPAHLSDAPAISALINSLMPHMTLQADGQGAEAFIATMTAAAIAGYIADPRYDYRAAWLGDALAGVIAMRDRSHVFHMFVASDLHGQGVARQMWHAVRQAGTVDAYTVNASRGAVPVYARFGFLATGPLVEQHGIAYQPMRLGL